jgi:hypothetical protein
MTISRTAIPVLAVTLLVVTRAHADVTVGGTRIVRDWHIPGGQTTYVFTFTLLFGAAVWLLARGIWFGDERKRIANLVLGGLSFALAVVMVLASQA